MIGPVLISFGTEKQKALISPMLSVEDFWCQGFSEPGAGSDLASLKTIAEDKGDHWLVNGQKLWTTNAHHANKIFLLVRTDTSVKPQKGISMLLADMDTPGIEVRPVITIDRRHEVNEVFLTDVVIPKDNIVGEPGQGWDIAKFLLSNERVGIAQVGLQKLLLRRLKSLVENQAGGHRYSNEVRRLEADILGLEVSGLRLLKAETITAAEPSLLKLKSSENTQRCFELAVEIAGLEALPHDEASQLHAEGCWLDASVGSLFSEYCESRAYTIFGGTSEVQHNIIARAALGL
jgi:alkylation response protein AidB-like acyl-CoA dehydrogenase